MDQEKKLNNQSAIHFGYDAAQSSPMRKGKSINLSTEDIQLDRQKRRKIQSDAADLQRNFPAAKWAISKHLDYVSTFTFQARTKDDELNKSIESLMRWWSLPQNIDIGGRHSLQSLIRLVEQCRTVAGDVFISKLANGRIQLIESDRVQSPNYGVRAGDLNGQPEEYIHGIRLSKSGKPIAYVVSERLNGYGSAYKFQAELPARFVYQLGYYSRYDQIRGISPLASAINAFADIQENNILHLAKMKVAQVFGVKVTRESTDPLDGETGERSEPYEFNFGGGPIMMDMDPNDDVSFLESKVGLQGDYKDFLESMLQEALKSLDIPYSFYAENYTNYSGSRSALLQYELSANAKRRDLITMLDNLTAWRLNMFIEDGVLELPEGVELKDIRWEWQSVGIPWIDPLKEAKASQTKIKLGLSSRQDECKERGKDWHEVAQKLAEEKRIMKELGLTDIDEKDNALDEYDLASEISEQLIEKIEEQRQ